ncbi:MAG: hypothetical protein FWD04_02690 [Conexibacteraceae bacterium]|nr:hypothetical protein [Conexibacteraceae bacterium]
MANAAPSRDLFPGEELISEGLAALAAREETVASLLVSMASRRLTALGDVVAEPFADPERRLYLMLEGELGTAAHSRYNALVRQLLSYCSAKEQDARRRKR